MTPPSDASPSSDAPGGPLGGEWRAQAERMQDRALPHGRVLITAPAPLDVGGLGRHLRELLDALDRIGQPNESVCRTSGTRSSTAPHPGLQVRALTTALTPLARFSRAWRMWAESVNFDAGAAHALPTADHLLAFNGAALAQFRAARRASWQSVSLVAANSHFRQVARQHALAYRQYPIERPWIRHLVKRNLAEYQLADRIFVASRYVRESFIEAGFSDSELALFPLTPDPRYRPFDSPPTSSTFNVVYVGSLTVHKGVPLLVDAIRRLPHTDMRLVLVGGFGTRGMRRFLERACAEDTRISVSPGDPLARLKDARLCVHPAYEDGFAYAPAEALACGVPVIVSEDTGMKDLIDPGVNGLVLPTGDLSALTQAIDAAYRGALTPNARGRCDRPR
jgi:glycosyltransferase involved in cell wall biosynthesis